MIGKAHPSKGVSIPKVTREPSAVVEAEIGNALRDVIQRDVELRFHSTTEASYCDIIPLADDRFEVIIRRDSFEAAKVDLDLKAKEIEEIIFGAFGRHYKDTPVEVRIIGLPTTPEDMERSMAQVSTQA